MPLALIATVKHTAPGATATAAALTAAWPEADRVLLEADPSGGVLAARWRLRPRPGLVEAVASLSEPDLALTSGEQTAMHLGESFPVVGAPAQPPQAERTVTVLCERGTGVIADPQRWVIADIGRLHPSAPTWGLLAVADAVVLVVAGTVPGVLALHGIAPQIVAECGNRAGIIVAPGEYGAGEINGTLIAPGLDLAVLGTTPEAKGRWWPRPRSPLTAWRTLAESARDLAGSAPALAIGADGELTEVSS